MRKTRNSSAAHAARANPSRFAETRPRKIPAARAAAVLLLASLALTGHVHADDAAKSAIAADAIREFGYEIVNTYPHSREAFTQGLVFRDGFLYESTGLNGRSSIRKVVLETGAVIRQRDLAHEFFGEGLTDLGRHLIQITWQSQTAFVYDIDTFEPVRTFAYAGEGWGLAHDGTHLIMSDGSATLRFLDPDTFAETARRTVTFRGEPVPQLNELEMVKGELFANVWPTEVIAIIDPQSGHVTGRIDLRGLLSAVDRQTPVDVLNGIAYDAERDRLFVTGKLWPKLFEIRLKPRD